MATFPIKNSVASSNSTRHTGEPAAPAPQKASKLMEILGGIEAANRLEINRVSCRPKPPAQPVVLVTPNAQGGQIARVGRPIDCSPNYEDAAKRVLSEVMFFDEKLHDHQNAVFTQHPGFREEMQRHKNTGVTYIHVDTHSDIITSEDPSRVSIANHLPETILKNPEITEVYWVTKPKIIELAETFTLAEISINSYDLSLLGRQKDVRLFIHKDTNEVIYETPTATNEYRGSSKLKSNAPSDVENYRIVTIRRRKVDDLPDFENKPVIANLDLDYFSNTGRDTIYWIKHKFKEPEVAYFFETLDSKHVRPFAVLTCLSPLYTPLEDVRIRQLSSRLEDYTRKQDLYATYTRAETQNSIEFSERNILLENNKTYLLTRQLLKLDLNTESPDTNIALDLKNNPELKAAVLKTKEVYHLTTDEEALAILRQLDIRDGVKDNVVNLWNWPNLMKHHSYSSSDDTPLRHAKPGQLIGLETVFQYEATQVRQQKPE